MIGAPDHDNRTRRDPWWTAPWMRRAPTVRGAEQLTGVGAGGVAAGVAREHAGQLGHPVLAVDRGAPW